MEEAVHPLIRSSTHPFIHSPRKERLPQEYDECVLERGTDAHDGQHGLNEQTSSCEREEGEVVEHVSELG